MLSYNVVSLFALHILLKQDNAMVFAINNLTMLKPTLITTCDQWRRQKSVNSVPVTMYSLKDKPYKSADHYWSLTKIEKRKIVKDECGKTNAKVSNGVTTKNDTQLATVVSFNTKSDSMVMTPLQSRCISDPSNCKQGITIEFWLKFHSGEIILTSGGYTKRDIGPGFILKYNSKIHRLEFLLSTTSQLWSMQFKVKKSTWVHLLFAWQRRQGVVVYENGDFLTKNETAKEIRYPSFLDKFKTLAVGNPKRFIKLKSEGARFEIGHLVIWIRYLRAEEIRLKAFMKVVRQNSMSRQCCKEKMDDPCSSDGCFYEEARCSNIGQRYPCICPRFKENKTCGNGFQEACYDVAKDCLTMARQPNYCNFYVKKMRKICAKTCNLCSSTVSINKKDLKIIIVAIAVGVTCVLMFLITIAVVMARMNSKRQGEFVPGNNRSGSITADPNTQEMIASSVDPAPRITDVPFKASKTKKTTKVKLSRSEDRTSEI